MERSKLDRAAKAVAQWRDEMPELGNLLPMEVIGRLNELSQLITHDHLAPLFAGHGLQGGEFDVLASLRRSGRPFALTPTQLYKATMISSGGMTARLDKLEKQGLIERRKNPNDRRGTLVALTAKGKILVDDVVKLHLDNERKILSGLSESEQKQLGNLLSKLLLSLK
jgi:DNA-binding MarR family transcriptional regulator